MKLAAYLEAEKLTFREFAEKIGVDDARTVQRYAVGERIPRPDIMARIAEATGGSVVANDFYGPPEDTPDPLSANPEPASAAGGGV